MARLKKALVLLLATAALAQQSNLMCKQEIRLQPLGAAPPTDVTTDAAGRIYILHENDGYMDVYTKDGQLIEHRGGQAEVRQQLTGVTVLSQWVGRLARSALLVSEPGQQLVKGVLVPGPHSLEWTPLSGMPEPIRGGVALARDLEGNFWVWSEQNHKIYEFNPQGQYFGARRTPQLRRPVQLAVDSQGNCYCLDTWGLHVLNPEGGTRYEVDGAQAMYLTGTDVLGLAGRDWLRRYAPDGNMQAQVRESETFREGEPVALSMNEDGDFFVYLRNPDRRDGMVLKMTMAGKILSEFPQPERIAVSPDPGLRLDYQGRIHFWNAKSQLLKIHPSGKVERTMAWVPSAEPKGQLVSPADLAYGPDGQVWVADAGNCRLQRFKFGSGWQKPITIGIQNGDPRGVPKSIAFNPFKLVYCVVYPRDQRGDVVLQTRDLEGKLLAQRSLCPSWGDPVVKIACDPGGELYIYQSRAKTVRGWEEAPTLLRYAARGQKVAQAGGDGPGLSPPGANSRRIQLKPQEDLIPWQGKLLVPSNGSIVLFDKELQAQREFGLIFKEGRNPQFGEFGGAVQSGKLLYLVDIGGRCLQRVVLP
ncbi:MAG: hypothetical protein U0931_27910 [Vulcanimicrobiota bacterium]